MSKRKQSPRPRSFRPEADRLETRQMLSGVVSGTDVDGDTWTLRLIGPGSLNVLKQPDAQGNPSPLNSKTEISTITIGGTDPLTSRVVGSVTKAAGGDGQVFFQTLNELPAKSVQEPNTGLGLLSINMPGFYLGNTTTNNTSTTTNPTAPTITIPDGVETFQFGGVDMTHDPYTPVTGTSTIDAVVELGLPTFTGTRVIINKTVSTHVSVPASTSTGTATTAQEGVVFTVSGRLDLFQANSIQGDATLPPAQFTDINSAATGTGGTSVIDSQAGAGNGGYAATGSYFSNGIKGSVGGQIGDVRIGGNATNFTTIVADPTLQSIDRVSNFSIGGETDNVMLVAPNGSRNVVFGKGMDNTEILSHVINTLKANRGALNSRVYVDRTISQIQIGGDVDSTDVQSGYSQNFSSIFSNILGDRITGTRSAPPKPSNAVPFGGMEVHVAGDVTNSVFAASVQPFAGKTVTLPDTGFGDPNQLVLPGGHIGGKIEGTIDNSGATPSTPDKAFFAQSVTSYSGPVVPPSVPEAPYPVKQPISAPGVPNLDKAPTVTLKLPTAKTGSSTHASTASVALGKATPKGPASKIK